MLVLVALHKIASRRAPTEPRLTFLSFSSFSPTFIQNIFARMFTSMRASGCQYTIHVAFVFHWRELRAKHTCERPARTRAAFNKQTSFQTLHYNNNPARNPQLTTASLKC